MYRSFFAEYSAAALRPGAESRRGGRGEVNVAAGHSLISQKILPYAAIIRSPTLISVQPGTRLGPHEIVSRAGSGGMGGVYRVRRRAARDADRSNAARDADRSEGVRWKTRASVLGAI